MTLAREKRAPLSLLLCLIWAAVGCTGDTILTQQPPDYYAESAQDGRQVLEPIEGDGPAYIVDATGKRWEVSHGRTYGLNPQEYQYGLGPYAISPLNNPTFLLPDEAGFPSPSDMMVLGLSMNDIVRAYPTWTRMANFEVINEDVGEPVAVAF